MTIKDIESLLEQGAYEAALRAAETYLETHPADADALYLKARSLFECSLRPDSEEQAAELINKAYEGFSEALAANSGHREALEYRAYTGACSQYITGREDAVMADLERLLESGDDVSRLRYMQWRSTAYLRDGLHDAAIADLRTIIDMAGQTFPDEPAQRNEIAAGMWYNIGEIQQQHLAEPEAALDSYREAFRHSPYKREYITAAALALEMGAYELAEQLMDVLPVVLGQVDDAFGSLLQQVKEAYAAHPDNPDVAVMYCKATAGVPSVMFDVEEEDVVLEQISLGKKMMQQFPEEKYFAQYTGKTFFEVQQFAEAMPYLEKAIATDNPHPMAIARWCYAKYKLEGAFPDNWPDSEYYFPYDWYLSAAVSSEWETASPAAREQHLVLNKFLYAKAIAQYKAYWFENGGNGTAHHMLHFSMCCMNYGLTLHDLGAYDAAIDIYTTGYNLVPFWEQLNARAMAHCEAGQFEPAVTDLGEVLEKFGDGLDPYQAASIYNRLIYICGGNLHDHQRALHWYERFMEVYDSGMEAAIEQLPDDERERVTAVVNSIKTSRGLMKGETDDLAARIGMMEKHLEEFPDDANAYFNLMQLYFQNGQYEHCAGSATSRLSIGEPGPLDIEDYVKTYFFRAKANRALGHLQKTWDDLLQCEQFTERNPASVDYDFHFLHGYMGDVAMERGDYPTAVERLSKSMHIATRNNWIWNESIAGYCYLLAHAYKQEGRLKEAMQQLKLIIRKYPAHPMAAEKLKEWKPWWNLF
ncbi:hypothetical protein EGT74_15920 [Chitinophaga lutea]|uniref:Tetratricopeptide repeat protein n=1 Tax=Chitinophaga lutea TaxID=2488634 RepID=A0A3N4PWU3_9BACT|nr:tetratricopeptide repeat protein [Chitinophaga lutea]RPE08527.1 hypothetical protein EGT74_15920 [Chitinophaga lutea]